MWEKTFTCIIIERCLIVWQTLFVMIYADIKKEVKVYVRCLLIMYTECVLKYKGLCITSPFHNLCTFSVLHYSCSSLIHFTLKHPYQLSIHVLLDFQLVASLSVQLVHCVWNIIILKWIFLSSSCFFVCPSIYLFVCSSVSHFSILE